MSTETVAAAGKVTTWITAAFSSSQVNNVYFFTGNKYVLLDYTPFEPKADYVVAGPGLIDSAFPSLVDNLFGELGIDCAFRLHHKDEAYIFCGKLCAHWNFAPTTGDDKILKGPVTVGRMFPFLRGSVFENGIDAAFESSTTGEAYLFKGNQCASINYDNQSAKLIFTKEITQVFKYLKGTPFESGVEAAFASHADNHVYLFKGDSYVLFKFGSGHTDDNPPINGVQKILPNWPGLKGFVPSTSNV